MKTPLALILALAPVAVRALDAPPSFTDAKIEVPAASLLADALGAAPGYVSDFGRKADAPPPPRVTFVSRMPIVAPKTDADSGMAKAPDASVDYALTVATPAVEPAK